MDKYGKIKQKIKFKSARLEEIFCINTLNDTDVLLVQ